ncbi:MAG TPA: hypothetical protein PJ993_02670 [Candidatus Saccharibacteria bacterium]|nr:hypothetical protein [Candidatus Saccharibacteria bacterium]HMT39809.1 hypothetical protein [Candidatus Saccharibacteria bacterium]
MNIVSLIVAVVVISGLLYIFLKQKAGKSFKQRSYSNSNLQTSSDRGSDVSQLDYELVKSKWADIEAMQKNGGSGIKNALIEADKLLDYVMIHKGFSGETMGDRLKSGGSRFANLNGVWAAHKLRNQIAHEVDHDLIPSQLQQAIKILGEAIKELGVPIR